MRVLPAHIDPFLVWGLGIWKATVMRRAMNEYALCSGELRAVIGKDTFCRAFRSCQFIIKVNPRLQEARCIVAITPDYHSHLWPLRLC